MGIDFINKKGPAIRKSWTRQARLQAVPDLFTSHPECATRSVIADLAEGVRIAPREEVMVQSSGNRLIALREMVAIAWNDKPPADLLAAIRERGGCALAEAAKIYERSGTVELRIKK